MEKAICKQNLKNQNQLAKFIGISSASMATMKSGKILPSEETLLKVAALADIPAEQALIDLNLWRSQKDPARLAAWQKISKLINKTALIALFLGVSSAVNSIISTLTNIYYVY